MLLSLANFIEHSGNEPTNILELDKVNAAVNRDYYCYNGILEYGCKTTIAMHFFPQVDIRFLKTKQYLQVIIKLIF